ncbi:MAG: alpha/beta fold hydrolase [Flavobacterium sp.]|nr:alpha/beta fold hydrolase [Flavobacterium sp.]
MELYSKIEGHGKPLLILHGFLGMSDNWKTLGTRYSENGFEVHMLDLRNHGRSFHSDEFTYEAMVADVAGYCESHNLDKISLIGHSMGGKVAMFFAIEHPEKLDKLIIADIGVKYYRPHHQDILAALNAVDFSAKPSRDDIDESMSSLVPDASTRQFLMKSLYRNQSKELEFRFNLPVFNKEIDNVGKAVPDGAKYDGPTLFVKGANSAYIKESHYDDIREVFPQAQFAIIQNAGHWLHAENPDDFFAETLTFLK